MPPFSGAIRILAIDDHALLRGGIAALLASHHDMQLIAEASSGKEGIEKFRELRPDITLMDLQLRDMSGIDAITAIRRESPTARIIVLTTYGGDVLAQRALKAGAQAYLLKNFVRLELPDTIRAVHGGLKRIDAEVADSLAQHVSDEVLSSREVEVLALVGAGNSNKQIAAKLEISDDTAKGHVKSILAKLGANDRTHAVTLGLKRGIIQL
jgi:DNA-binding NarL/FixJ family response regulator